MYCTAETFNEELLEAEWREFHYTFPQTFLGVKSERVFWKGRCAKNLFILQTGRAVGSFFKLQSQYMCPETTTYFASRRFLVHRSL